MSATNLDASDRLKDAISYSFDEPVTAYLTDAVLVAGCCVGVTHRHRKADFLAVLLMVIGFEPLMSNMRSSEAPSGRYILKVAASM